MKRSINVVGSAIAAIIGLAILVGLALAGAALIVYALAGA